jgi:O-acetyl-ADP-ribose deacetylase (regulator of RNase III)
MLKYKKGCLITAAQSGEVNVIAHQCNCQNNMGRGIAPLIKRAFPEAWEADKETIKGSKRKLGNLTVAKSGEVTVFNLYGQYRYGVDKQHTDYDALRSSLKLMATHLIRPYDKVGLPLIGCGLAGGDWEVVSKIIEEELEGFDVTIYEL